MNTVYLLIGGNQGDVRQTFAKVISDLEKKDIVIKRRSALYKTAAWGMENQPDFLNQIVEAETAYPPQELLDILLQTEKENGRTRQEKYGPRIIDIDILFFNNERINQPDLVIPHPLIQERNFVLYPLAELMPNFIHPVFNKTITELLRESKDRLQVEKLPD